MAGPSSSRYSVPNHQQPDQEVAMAESQPTKFCSRCKENKTKSEFYRNRSRKDGLCHECKSCKNIVNTSWASRNRSKMRQYIRKCTRKNYQVYYAKQLEWIHKNRERIRERERENYRKDIESSRQRNRKKYAANKSARVLSVLKWAGKNRSRVLAYDNSRRARKLHATPQWTDLSKIQQFYEEARRRTLSTGVPHHVDHIVPLQGKYVCGLHVENNLQVITAAENWSKNRNFKDA